MISLKAMRTDPFLFGGALIDFFKFPLKKKLRVESEMLSAGEFPEKVSESCGNSKSEWYVSMYRPVS